MSRNIRCEKARLRLLCLKLLTAQQLKPRVKTAKVMWHVYFRSGVFRLSVMYNGMRPNIEQSVSVPFGEQKQHLSSLARSRRFSRHSRDLRFVSKLAVSLAEPTLKFEFKRGKWRRLQISSSDTSSRSSPRFSDFQNSYSFENSEGLEGLKNTP